MLSDSPTRNATLTLVSACDAHVSLIAILCSVLPGAEQTITNSNIGLSDGHKLLADIRAVILPGCTYWRVSLLIFSSQPCTIAKQITYNRIIRQPRKMENLRVYIGTHTHTHMAWSWVYMCIECIIYIPNKVMGFEFSWVTLKHLSLIHILFILPMFGTQISTDMHRYSCPSSVG